MNYEKKDFSFGKKWAIFILLSFLFIVPLALYSAETTVEFDVTMPPVGAFAYCDIAQTEANRTTVTTVSGTRYDLVCPLINLSLNNMTVAGGVYTYTGPGQDLVLRMSSVQKGSAASTRVHVAWHHKPNGGVDPWEELPESRVGQYMKTADEAVAHAPAYGLVTAETGDQFKMVVWSDSAGDNIVTTHLVGMVEPWGR